ncbi:hypothetical protein [Polaromonas sp. AER18D-145]|uniref:hypothetical protein n=1 Tax=Polaromonas sp. AER18D-145 TaxID=1977060 RepID=UPI000BBB9A76|nr:hypothetical protein [Polaromonas sp. AER18D-145]
MNSKRQSKKRDEPVAGSCYACVCTATSREHVPPKNLFPEAKDFQGEDLRQQLITVPSCDIHNLAKSQDDEFLMVCLAGLVGNNSIGYRHNFGKVGRAVRRSAGRLLQKIFIAPQRLYRVELKDNKFVDVLWGSPDVPRLRRCFGQIVRGLLFHDFGRAFEGQVHIHLAFLHLEAGNAKTFNDFLKKRLEMDLVDCPKLGSNPEVFYYQRSEPDEFGLFAYRLRFYGRVEVMAGVLPAASNPPANIIQKFIEGGIKTIVTLGPEEFEFN